MGSQNADAVGSFPVAACPYDKVVSHGHECKDTSIGSVFVRKDISIVSDCRLVTLSILNFLPPQGVVNGVDICWPFGVRTLQGR